MPYVTFQNADLSTVDLSPIIYLIYYYHTVHEMGISGGELDPGCDTITKFHHVDQTRRLFIFDM